MHHIFLRDRKRDRKRDRTGCYTSRGAIAALPYESSGFVYLDNLKTYNPLVDPKGGTTVLSASKIPGIKGSPSRYLLLLVKKEGGMLSLVTYDAHTDTVVSSNDNTATTHYMLAYSWGACNGNVTRGLVEISFSNDSSASCPPRACTTRARTATL